MAKFVFALLAFMSIASWGIMITKYLRFRRAEQQNRDFLETFRRSQRFGEVNTIAGRLDSSPLAGLFQAGYVEIDSQVKDVKEGAAGRGDTSDPGYRIRSLDGLGRTMRRSMGVEQLVMARGIRFLASTASASPFIGLFGTVWGIMLAFRNIGVTGSTSLSTVAPGIAEALINTAAGLAAAIPALLGFNYYSARIREFRAEMEDFILEFINLAERNFT